MTPPPTAPARPLTAQPLTAQPLTAVNAYSKKTKIRIARGQAPRGIPAHSLDHREDLTNRGIFTFCCLLWIACCRLGYPSRPSFKNPKLSQTFPKSPYIGGFQLPSHSPSKLPYIGGSNHLLPFLTFSLVGYRPPFFFYFPFFWWGCAPFFLFIFFISFSWWGYAPFFIIFSFLTQSFISLAQSLITLINWNLTRFIIQSSTGFITQNLITLINYRLISLKFPFYTLTP